MKAKKCENCLYFEVSSDWKDQGECKRYPRVCNPNTFHWLYPVMGVHDWCGEYFPKDPTEREGIIEFAPKEESCQQ